MAAEMRRRAEAAPGLERDYFIWLAAEWDRTADREGAPGARPSRPEPWLARV
jgi:hypothetical protein